jgi:hypothetical protein
MQKTIELLTSPRFKSFYWRSAMMILAGFIDLIVSNLSDFELGNQTTVVLGLVLGEVSKALNRHGR